MSTISSISDSDLLTSYIDKSTAATKAAQTAMSNNVSNGVNGSGASSLTGNFNTFLKILTTQLKNQDPTAPMDTNQFTQELVQFSGVEQQLKTNSLLQSLVDANGASGVRGLLGYVGQYVEVPAENQLLVQNGKAQLAYTLPTAAQDVTLTVKDQATGQTIITLAGSKNLGLNRITWDGKDSKGNQLADGSYGLSVTAKDSGGNPITIDDVRLTGLVTGVQAADANGNDLMLGPYLVIPDTKVQTVFSPSMITPTPTSNNTGNSDDTSTPTT